MSKVKIEGNASGTGTLTIAAPNTNTDRTLTLPDGAGEILTDASDITSQAMNGPAFGAKMSATQTFSANTWTKLAFNQEDFDTDSCYDTSNYRFTPTVAGYYQVTACGRIYATATNPNGINLGVYKNGSEEAIAQSYVVSQQVQAGLSMARLIYLNGTTDYIEAYCYLYGGSGTLGINGDRTASWFTAALMRAA